MRSHAENSKYVARLEKLCEEYPRYLNLDFDVDVYGAPTPYVDFLYSIDISLWDSVDLSSFDNAHTAVSDYLAAHEGKYGKMLLIHKYIPSEDLT